MKRIRVFMPAVAMWAVAGPVTPARAVPSIALGTLNLQPNTPGQTVEVFVTGGDEVMGLSLYLQVANGGPELEELGELPPGGGIDGPAITGVDILTDTIFAGNNTGQVDGTAGMQVPQVAMVSTTTASGTVAAEGLLARVTLDTTGFAGGSFHLTLSVLGTPTDFAGIAASLSDGVIVVGSAEPAIVNEPPSVNAGPDQNVAAASTVQLAGTGNDPEGQTVTYTWRQIHGPPVVLSHPSSPDTSFAVPAGLVNTELAFELTVSDGVEASSDTVVVMVGPSEQLFSVDAGADRTVAAGALVQLAAAITSPDARFLSLDWIQVDGPAVTLTAADTANPTFVAPVGVTNTRLTFEFRAFDGTYEAVDTVSIEVNASDARPSADAGPDQAVPAGAAVQLAGSATDPAGQGVTYLWVQTDGPAVVLSSDLTPDPTFTSPALSQDSMLIFELQVSDGGETSVDTVTIHVAAAPSPVPDQTDQDSGTTAQDQTSSTPQEQSPSPLSYFLNTPLAAAMAAALILLALLLLLLLWI